MMGGIVSVYGTTGTLNSDVKIREFPSMESNIVATRKKGRVFEILQTVDTKTQGIWYQTPTGYIYEKFLTLNMEETPTKEITKTQEVYQEIVPPSLPNLIPLPLPLLKPPEKSQKNESKIEPILHDRRENIKENTQSDTIEDINTTKRNPQKEEKELILNSYAEALQLYKKKEYQGAYGVFNDLFLKNLNNLNINFYLGRSAYELGLFDEAILAYERILFEKQDTLRVQFELGRTYVAKENYLYGKKYFEEIVANNETPNDLKVVSQKYLELIDEKISKHKIGGALIFGINYDSNINNSSKNSVFSNVYIPNFNTYVDMNNSTKKESGVSHQEIAILNHKYQLNDLMEIKTDGMFFGKFMFDSDLKEKNIKMGGIASALSIQHQENLILEYGVFLDNLWVGGENYMQSYGIFPKVHFLKDPKTVVDGHFKYQKKLYQQQTNKQKNSNYSEIGVTYKFAYDEKFTLIPNIFISKENASNKEAIGVDNNAFGIGFGVNILQTPKWFLMPSSNYKITKYEDIDTSYLKKQEDKELSIKLSSTYIYSSLWIVQGELGHTIQSSNIEPNQYTKHNFGINLIRSF